MFRAFLAVLMCVATGPTIAETPSKPIAGKLGKLAEVDVAVGEGGLLLGQVVTSAGVPIEGATVAVSTDDNRYAETKTNKHGAFAFRGVTGRAELVGPKCRQPVRAWTGDSAPPAATPAVLLVEGSVLARGQRHPGPAVQGFFSQGKQLMANPVFVAGVVGTAVAVPVALANADDDDDPSTP